MEVSVLKKYWDYINYIKSLIKNPLYALYQKRLLRKVKNWQIPQHIGIILDGNRRFAQENGLDNPILGHARGADKLVEVLDWCHQLGIKIVSIWVFSTDNFRRQEDEVKGLLNLIESKTREWTYRDEVHNNRIQIRAIGKLELLPESLQEAIRTAEEVTKGYDNFILNVAIAYSGREEVTEAFRGYLLSQAREGKNLFQVAEEIKSEDISPYLYTSGLPDPDLIIRTSGEIRLSGFLLWQSVYSEYYFCDVYWPAFRKIDLMRAIRDYSNRQRRFGR